MKNQLFEPLNCKGSRRMTAAEVAETTTATPPAWVSQLNQSLADDPNPTEAPAKPVVENPAFKSWFSGSKVVDGSGKPLVVYHGTDKNFDTFKTNGEGKTDGTGAWFTDDPANAGTYGKTHMPVYLNLRWPLEVWCEGSDWDRLSAPLAVGEDPKWPDDELFRALDIPMDEWDDFASSDDIARQARIKGYDGVIFHQMKDTGGDIFNPQNTTYVAFKQNQIKSAIGNSGEFNADSKNITAAARTTPLNQLQLNPNGLAIAKATWVWDKDYKHLNDKPVVVMPMPDGTFYVLDGYHRVVQAIREGKTEVETRLVPYNEERLQSEGDPATWEKTASAGEELYHGTIISAVPSILQNGLRPNLAMENGKPVYDITAVWAVTEKEQALHYAFYRTTEPDWSDGSLAEPEQRDKFLAARDCALVVLDGTPFEHRTGRSCMRQSEGVVEPKFIKKIEIYNCLDLYKARLRTGYYGDAKVMKTAAKVEKSVLTAFMQNLWSQTYGNPFNPRERVWNDVAGIECRPFDGRIHLSFIRSFEKNTGGGRDALKFLTDLADKHGVEMDLDAKPVGDDGLKVNKLRSWYMRNGFEPKQGREGMVRMPKGADSNRLKLNGDMMEIPFDKKSSSPNIVEKVNAVVLLDGDKEIGHVGFRAGSHGKYRMGEISDSKVEETHRGQGYGVQMYIALAQLAKRDGVSFLTSNLSGNLSDDAEHVWHALIRKGYKIKEVESADSTTGNRYFKWYLNQDKRASNPPPLYHGTNGDFTSFNVSPRGSFGSGIYLTTNRESAATWGDTIYSCKVNLNNPYYADADFSVGDEYDFDSEALPTLLHFLGEDETVNAVAASPDGLFGSELTQAVKAKGFDGIVATYEDGSINVIAFDPAQVSIVDKKTATNNKPFKEWMGNIKTLPQSNSKYLTVTDYKSTGDAPLEPFMEGKYTIRKGFSEYRKHFSEDAPIVRMGFYTVYDGDKAIASMHPGSLVVSPKYRKQGIGTALAKEFMKDYPDYRPVSVSNKSKRVFERAFQAKLAYNYGTSLDRFNTILYLDDVRVPSGFGITHVRTYEEFVQYMRTHPVPDLISLDHDLAEEHLPTPEEEQERYETNSIPYEAYTEKTGLAACQWLVDNDVPVKHWQVHSANPVGGDNMFEVLMSHYPEGNVRVNIPHRNTEEQVYGGRVKGGFRIKASLHSTPALTFTVTRNSQYTVTLKAYAKDGFTNGDNTVDYKAGESVGYLKLEESTDEGVFVSDVKADEFLRNHGVGVALYEAAIRYAKRKGYKTFSRGYPRTPDAARVWQSLAKKYTVSGGDEIELSKTADAKNWDFYEKQPYDEDEEDDIYQQESFDREEELTDIELVSKYVYSAPESLSEDELVRLGDLVKGSKCSASRIIRVERKKTRAVVGQIVDFRMPLSFTKRVADVIRGKSPSATAYTSHHDGFMLINNPTRGLDVDYSKLKFVSHSAVTEQEVLVAGKYKVIKIGRVIEPGTALRTKSKDGEISGYDAADSRFVPLIVLEEVHDAPKTAAETVAPAASMAELKERVREELEARRPTEEQIDQWGIMDDLPITPDGGLMLWRAIRVPKEFVSNPKAAPYQWQTQGFGAYWSYTPANAHPYCAAENVEHVDVVVEAQLGPHDVNWESVWESILYFHKQGETEVRLSDHEQLHITEISVDGKRVDTQLFGTYYIRASKAAAAGNSVLQSIDRGFQYDPFYGKHLTQGRERQIAAIEGYLDGTFGHIGEYTDGTYRVRILNDAEHTKIIEKRGDPFPVPAGKWMQLPEPGWNKEVYWGLSEFEQATMECKEQVERWAPSEFEDLKKKFYQPYEAQEEHLREVRRDHPDWFTEKSRRTAAVKAPVKFMYHRTHKSRVDDILRDGLKINSGINLTQAGTWAHEYYDCNPVYVSIKPDAYSHAKESVLLKVNVESLVLVADLPGLAGTGGYVDDDSMYFEERGGQFIGMEIPYEDLLEPDTWECQYAIKYTGSAACLQDISPDRISLAEPKII